MLRRAFSIGNPLALERGFPSLPGHPPKLSQLVFTRPTLPKYWSTSRADFSTKHRIQDSNPVLVIVHADLGYLFFQGTPRPFSARFQRKFYFLEVGATIYNIHSSPPPQNNLPSITVARRPHQRTKTLATLS